MVTGRMISRHFLPVKITVTCGRMLNFDEHSDFDVIFKVIFLLPLFSDSWLRCATRRNSLTSTASFS